MENTIDIIDLLKKIWLKKWRLFLWTVIGLFTGAIIAISIPNEFVCVVRVVPESKDNQSQSMGSLGGLAAMVGVGGAGASGGGLSEMMYSDVVKSTPFLRQFNDMIIIIDDKEVPLRSYVINDLKQPWWGMLFQLPSKAIKLIKGGDIEDENGGKAKSKYLPSDEQREFETILASRISAKLDEKSGLITVNVKFQDPIATAILADSVLTKLNSFIIQYRTSKARYDLKMAEQMKAEAMEKYYFAEQEYANAMDRNKNLTSKSALVKVDRLENEKNLSFQVYQQLASQVEMSKIKLQEVTPIATIIDPAVAPSFADSPKKKIITLVMGVLFALAYAGVILVKDLAQTTKKSI